MLPARVRTAHADARAVEGMARAADGGGAATLRGIRVMASGLPHPQFNSAVVTGPDIDLDGARAFYAERDLPWGALVPAGMAWRGGRQVGSLPLMGVSRGGLPHYDAGERARPHRHHDTRADGRHRHAGGNRICEATQRWDRDCNRHEPFGHYASD